MRSLWEVGALILGPLAIVGLIAQSMRSIDRNLRARQSRTRKMKSL